MRAARLPVAPSHTNPDLGPESLNEERSPRISSVEPPRKLRRSSVSPILVQCLSLYATWLATSVHGGGPATPTLIRRAANRASTGSGRIGTVRRTEKQTETMLMLVLLWLIIMVMMMMMRTP